MFPKKLGGTSIVSVVHTRNFFAPEKDSSWTTCRTPLSFAAAACARGPSPAFGDCGPEFCVPASICSGSMPGNRCNDGLEMMEAPSFDSNFTTNCTLRRTPPTSSQGSQMLYEWPSSDSL
ncbi:MAG: hypothetical protein JXM70_09870 [Pirellulales bacterium]|nr:hypothetical protein [Pirellulales bacterium]